MSLWMWDKARTCTSKYNSACQRKMRNTVAQWHLWKVRRLYGVKWSSVVRYLCERLHEFSSCFRCFKVHCLGYFFWEGILCFCPLLICYRPGHMELSPKVREDNQIIVAWKANILLGAFPFACSAALLSARLMCVHVPSEVLCSKHDLYYVFHQPS